jgi:hypothetical protein
MTVPKLYNISLSFSTFLFPSLSEHATVLFALQVNKQFLRKRTINIHQLSEDCMVVGIHGLKNFI